MTNYTAEEIRNQAAEWDARNAEQKAKHEAQYRAFTEALNTILNAIEKKVAESLAETELPLEIKAGDTWHTGVEVRVEAYQRDVHAENKALAWNWKVTCENGNVKKESGCWSGLQATTDEQIANLYKTARALEILNSLNWKELLDVTLPEYKDYITERNGIGPRPDFNQQIKEAELRDLVGSDTLVKGTNEYGRGTRWYMIVKETPKQYEIRSIGDYYLDNGTTAEQIKGYYTERMTKEKLLGRIYFPIETREIA